MRAILTHFVICLHPMQLLQGVLGRGQIDKIEPIWRQLHEGLAMKLTIDEMIAEGDVVAVRYTESGTFRASFLGHQPTGRSYELIAMEGLWFATAKFNSDGPRATRRRRRATSACPWNDYPLKIDRA